MSDQRLLWRVSELSQHLKALLEGDPYLWDLWVEGEVSNFRRASSGHCYFTLRESDCAIACVLWREWAARHSSLPGDGQAILAHGHVSIYEARGAYQLYVDQIRPAGVGLRYLEFEELKRRLEAEGLFDPERKRPLPKFPARIGIVTSADGAALQDILNVLRRRFPSAQVVLSPTLVQGEEAPERIARALALLDRLGGVDVAILARGGGSIEELWAFNSEVVVRAVAACAAPVVSGVGHETDFTLADFVADVRAPTPSAAAELVAPDSEAVREELRNMEWGLVKVLRARLEGFQDELGRLCAGLSRASPARRIAEHRQRTDDLERQARRAIRHALDLRRERWHGRVAQLRGLSPESILGRGYAIARRLPSGLSIRKVAQVQEGDPVEIQVSDGRFRGVVTGIEGASE